MSEDSGSLYETARAIRHIMGDCSNMAEPRMRYSLAAVGIGLVFGVRLACAAVPEDPTQVEPIAVGASAPAFVAREVNGKRFHFDPAGLKSPVLIIFYRGGWCPYCNQHLQDLHVVEPQISDLGYQVLFLSTDRPALLYASLKEKVKYHILSDASMNAARAFGVAYRLDAKTLQYLKSEGIDLEATQGTKTHELPVPSVFIVDRSGIVRFRHFNEAGLVRDWRLELNAAIDRRRADGVGMPGAAHNDPQVPNAAACWP